MSGSNLVRGVVAQYSEPDAANSSCEQLVSRNTCLGSGRSMMTVRLVVGNALAH